MNTNLEEHMSEEDEGSASTEEVDYANRSQESSDSHHFQQLLYE
jgi:hypothetical protein